MEITLYSTGCPKCQVLEKKLNAKNLEFTVVNDPVEIRKTGFLSVPLMKIDDGPIMQFADANNWINNYNEGDK